LKTTKTTNEEQVMNNKSWSQKAILKTVPTSLQLRFGRNHAALRRRLLSAAWLLLGALSPFVHAQTPGSLDTSFDPGSGANDNVNSVALQPDGKIVLGGRFTTFNGVARDGIARLNPNGTLDDSFAATTNQGNGVFSVVVQPDEKIVLGGFFSTVNGTPRDQIARLNPDGTLDTSFVPGLGTDGGFFSVAVQPTDEKIVVGGVFNFIHGTRRSGIARLNADGNIDNSFDPGEGTNSGSVYSVAVQPDGKIVIGGFFNTINVTPRNDIARLNPDGSLDTNFDPGEGAGPTGSGVRSVAVQPDGKILLGGDFTTINGVTRNHIARLNANGSLDTAFNPSTDTQALVYSIAVQTDGKIVIGGFFRLVNGVARNSIARLNSDGSLDTGFDPSPGGVRNGSGSTAGVGQVNSVALQSDGKILIGGIFSFVNGVARNQIARLNGGNGDPVAPSQLLNISTRMRVQTGENVLIGGFIITGTDSKNVIIRGIGPSLSSFFSGVLANPTLELFQGSTLLQSNNDWKDTQRIEIEATSLQPSNDFESAIVRMLPPGSYTAIVRGLAGTTGIGVVEAYDLNRTANSKFANISTRGFVETGDNVMIGGMIIGPATGSTSRIVVRAIGPSLSAFGIAGAVQDPTVDLIDVNGTTLSSNDDWQQGQPAELQQLNLAPTDPRESALVTTLAPGAYTAIVRGVGNTTGVGLVEGYHVQ
jgi:uncharacterized delta-60 repeat protein